MAWKPALSILCLALAADVFSATATLPPDAVLIELQEWKPPSGRAEADARDVLARIAANEPAAAVALMQGWQDPVRFELAAVIVIDALQASPDSPSSRAALAALALEPVRLFRRHEETAADWFLPMFDVGARASSTLKLFDFLRGRDALVATIEKDPIAAFAPSVPPSLVAAAIGELAPQTLTRVATLAMGDRIELPSAAWSALARRQPSADLLAKVIEVAEPIDVLPLIPDVIRKIDPDVATNWLELTTTKSELASAAILSLGTVAAKHAPAEAALARHLGDPKTGASAAAAFARLDRVDRLERIDVHLATAKSAEAVRDLALALRLEGSASARARLDRLGHDPRLPASARAELQP
jgi:hypothetical protein